jgi:hypothetical protein
MIHEATHLHTGQVRLSSTENPGDLTYADRSTDLRKRSRSFVTSWIAGVYARPNWRLRTF